MSHTDEQLSDAQEIFHTLAVNDRLASKLIFSSLRCIGQYASAELQTEILAELAPEVLAQGIEFAEFLNIAHSLQDASEADADLISAFHTLDEDGRGILTAANARLLLTSVAGISNDEAQEVLVTCYEGAAPEEVDFDHYMKIMKSDLF